MTEADPQVMQCMEVWGGNTPVESAVGMNGLDAWVYCKPCQQADGGGDVYFVSSCATGRIIRLLVADVSGHGVGARDIATQLRSLMREHVNRLDQQVFVREMNRKFTALSQLSCFATAIVTTFFAPTNRLVLCNAGHPSPLLYRATDKSWTLMDKREDVSGRKDGVWNLPLGIEDLTDYEQFGADLAVGDLVLCYSDSLMESKNAGGEMLGEEGLLGVVNALPVTEPGKVIDQITAALVALWPTNLSDDDVTILLFRPNGSATPPPIARRIASPLRILAGSVRAILNGEHMPLPDSHPANVGGAMFDRLNHIDRTKPPAG